jgi:Holliday junction resolvasome RuvABC endonuclease subunit
MNVLSLDIASTTGWAMDTQVYGTWDFKTKKDESMGMKLIRFRSKLEEVHKLEPLDIIIYERPAGQHANSIIHQAKLIAILETFCEAKGIEYRAYSASEIKKFATGKGNANKQAMIDAAKTKYGYTGSDDNEADAIHMRELFREEMNL